VSVETAYDGWADPYVHDAKASKGWRFRSSLHRPAPSVPLVVPVDRPDMRAEVRSSVMDWMRLDRICDGAVLPDYRHADEGPALAREEAFEAWREAVQACDVASGRGVGRCGLVSPPTSQTSPLRRRSTGLAVAAREALRDHLGLFETGTDAGRISRLRRAVGFSARVHLVDVELPSFCAMVTLTYEGGQEAWAPKHVASFMDTVRKWVARHPVPFRLRYVWVAELQKRGSVHYHIALFLPHGVTLPKPDQAGWWAHGATNVQAARGAVQYLMKYLSKGSKASDFKLPGGARCYGCGGLGQAMRLARRWLSLPGFIKSRADVAQSSGWRRFAGGGWVDPDGSLWSSEFRMVMAGGLRCLERVVDHGRPFEVDGIWSSWPRAIQ